MAAADTPAPAAPRPQVVLVRKKKVGHGGRHGGAWKVAYADFVTALMALFIVLWLMSSDQDVKDTISAYFNHPAGPSKVVRSVAAGAGNAIELRSEEMDQLRDKIRQALMQTPNFRKLKDYIEVTVTPDGLRIELLESESGMFFETGKPVPTAAGADLLARLAKELGSLPNNILIEGHTDSRPYAGDGSYTNWELSADRANSARRIMQEHGLRPQQVVQVRGYADTQLRRPNQPEAASNRRISVIVQWLAEPAKPEPKPQPPKPH